MSWLDIVKLLLEALSPVLIALLSKNTELTKRNLQHVDKLQHEWRDRMRQHESFQQEIKLAVKDNDADIKKILSLWNDSRGDSL